MLAGGEEIPASPLNMIGPMKQTKVLNIFLSLVFLVLVFFIVLEIKHHQEHVQRIALAGQIQKASQSLMLDFALSHSTFLDLPIDGVWHEKFAFKNDGLVTLKYFINEGHLFRLNRGRETLVADHIVLLRVRRQRNRPDIVEIEIEARNNISVASYLKVRLAQ